MYVKWALFGTVLSFSKNREQKVRRYRQKYDQHIAQFEKERESGEAVIILKWFDAKYPILDKDRLRRYEQIRTSGLDFISENITLNKPS